MSVFYYNFGGKIGWTLQKMFPKFCSEAYLKLQFLLRNKSQKDYIKYFLSKDVLPHPLLVSIETINRCNSDCAFCISNRNLEKRPFKIMSDELFVSIIDQLSDWGYEGHLYLCGNNEPFLDTKIIERVKYAREKLPNSFIFISTNGLLLDIDKVKKIIPYLNQLIINNYCLDMKLHDNIKEIIDYANNHYEEFYNVELFVQIRYKNAILTNRAGSAPNKKYKKVIKSTCLLPFTDMMIFSDGKVGICCCDNLESISMADLTKITLKEAWDSPEYKKVREAIKNSRSDYQFCKYCDFIDAGFRNDLTNDTMLNRKLDYGQRYTFFRRRHNKIK